MLQTQNIDVEIQGLSQKGSDLASVPGTLDRAINVEFDTPPDLNKRRGYRRIATSVDLQGNTVEAVFCAVATFGNELVVYGSEFLYAVVSDRGEVDGASIVRRGPVNRGNYTVSHVVSSSLASEAPPE